MRRNKKNRLLSLLALGVTGVALMGAACGGNGKKEESKDVSTKLSFIDGDDGKILSLNGKYQTTDGALGVAVAYDDIDGVSETFYAHYFSVEKKDGGYEAKAQVTTEKGSIVSATDFIVEADGKVSISRKIKVEKGNAEDLGFMSFFPMETVTAKKAEDYQWFSPANYYGNDDYTFTGVSGKSGFNGKHSMITADNMGAPLVMMYDGNIGLSVLDKTAGMRETVAADMSIQTSWILVDERFNMPGIGISNVEREDGMHVQLVHAYPAYSYNYLSIHPFNAQYRMLPMKENLERTVGFEWTVGDYTSFTKASETTWREAYDDYAVVDKRYAATDVRDVLLRAVDASFGVANGIPQYMTKADHYEAESGFLYRNADLGWLMLAEGRRTMNPTYVDHALQVINTQVRLGRLDEGILFSDPLHRARASSDALTSLVRAYERELAYGEKHTDWISYLIKRAEVRMTNGRWIDAQFLTELARVTGNKTYLDKSVELMEEEMINHAKFRYTGGITNPAGDPFIDREAGIIALDIYVNLYEQTGAEQWLAMAKQTAFFVESTHQLQAIMLDVYDCTGYENDALDGTPTMQGWLGNGKIMPYGLSYIGGQCTSADISGVLAAPEYLRLYELTGDQHYLDFYQYITYNATLYVNMGDKVGLMDDMLHSSGLGFINEYVGLAVSGDKAVSRRGSVHDSTIAWCAFSILQNYERTYNYLQKEGEADSHYVAVDDFTRSFNVAKNKYKTNVTDGTVFDLLEVCTIEKIVNFDGDISHSLDGKAWTKKDGETVNARYVKLHTQTVAENVEIIGLPVLYQELSRNQTVSCSNGNTGYEAVDGNYGTGWTVSNNSTLTIDLGGLHDIFTVATTFAFEGNHNFKVELSADGEVWTEYAVYTGKRRVYVSEESALGVRYVRVVYTSGVSPRLTEIKVLGL